MEEQDYNNKLYEWMSRILNVVIASVLWLLCCIPIFTIGAATTALYNTIHRCVVHEREDVWGCFTSTFKKHFKRSTKFWLIMLLLLAFFFIDWCVTYVLNRMGNPLGGMNILCLICMGFIALWSIFMFSYLARFPKDLHVMKNGILILMANLPQALLIVLVTALMVVLVMWQSVFLFFAPGVVAICCEKLLEPAFYKIMTQEERDREERELKMERGEYVEEEPADTEEMSVTSKSNAQVQESEVQSDSPTEDKKSGRKKTKRKK